MNFVSIKLAK